MEVHRDSAGVVNVARISGDLDSLSAADIHEQIVPILMDRKPVLLDFSGVRHVSDAGLRTMLVVYRQAQAVDGKVAVVGLSTELCGVLAATGYLRFFHIADDFDGGMRALLAEADARSVLS